MGKLCLGLAFVGLIACGSNKAVPDAHVVNIDAPAAIDGKTPDAAPVLDFSCFGNAAPSPTASSILVGGTYTETTYTTTIVMTPINMGSVTICAANTDCTAGNKIGNTLMTDANGTFTSASIASLSPVDVSISATASGETPVNLYPPSPLVANAEMLPVTTISTTDLGVVEFLEHITQSPSKGIIAIAVIDCSNPPNTVPGATVTLTQGGNPIAGTTDVNSAMFGGQLSFNVPAGLTHVAASYNNMMFRAHDVTVVAAQMTATGVKPGY